MGRGTCTGGPNVTKHKPDSSATVVMRVVAGALLLAGGMLVWPCGRAMFGGTTSTQDVTPEQMLIGGRLMRVSFPPSCRPLGFLHESWLDEYVALKIEIDASEYPTFIASSPFSGIALDRERLWINSVSSDWWDPDQLEPYGNVPGQSAFRSGAASVGPGEYLKIVVDQRDERKYIIYLEYLKP